MVEIVLTEYCTLNNTVALDYDFAWKQDVYSMISINLIILNYKTSIPGGIALSTGQKRIVLVPVSEL